LCPGGTFGNRCADSRVKTLKISIAQSLTRACGMPFHDSRMPIIFETKHKFVAPQWTLRWRLDGAATC
jgi:hypothetical protein